MSTSSRPEDSLRKDGLSLRGFLSEAVFVGAEDIRVRRCVDRADKCTPGDVFVPRRSPTADEHDRVEEAVRRGAVAVVAERLLPVSVPQCLIEDTHQAYARICHALAGDPSRRMLSIAVVGTHGKTTTSLFVSSMLKKLGGAVAYYTSLGASDSTACDRTATRPPGARRLANWMRKADMAGAPAAVVELTPAMLANQVAAGVEFDLIILTGLRAGQNRGAANVREYTLLLDRFLASLKPHGMLLYNADDAQAAAWAERCDATAVSYGLDAAEHVRAKRLSRMGGEQQLLVSAGHLLMPLTLKIPGDHVARAALAAVATSWMFDLPVPKAIAGVELLQSIPGRMQRIQESVEAPVYIDAGSTPDQLAVATHALRQHQLGPATVVLDLNSRVTQRCRQRLGEVLDRSSARIVLSGSDLSATATQSIAMDVLGGVRSPGRVHVIPDREAAINWAVDNTDSGAILLAGCGVQGWTSRDGEPVNDEMLAKAAVRRRNQIKTAPNLGIFPPPESNTVFPIDS
ncbi:MAG: Mur ligase family protein [bacterium]|nr:Mur ligase family protein [bacterium]